MDSFRVSDTMSLVIVDDDNFIEKSEIENIINNKNYFKNEKKIILKNYTKKKN